MSIYIIVFKARSLYDENDSMLIGFLPFGEIPENSVLVNAIFDPNCLVEVETGGIKGVHYDKHLALEHLKLEKAWRTQDKVWMVEITEKGAKRVNK